MTRWASVLVLAAGLMGAAGLAMQAAAAHLGGGDVARTAADILLIHAAVVLAVACPVLTGHRARRGLLASASVLAVGTVTFSIDLALLAFLGARPFPPAAPIGGTGMILGWLMLAATGLTSFFQRKA